MGAYVGTRPVANGQPIIRQDAPTSVIPVNGADVGAVGNDKNYDKDKKEIARLQSKSATYQLYEAKWAFYLAAYEGGERFACKENIFKHPREHPEDFEERSKRLFYHNFCRPLVNFYTTFIFAETIQRDGGKNGAWFNNFILDVNNKGEDIGSFMGQVCDDMQIFGMSYILVDAPQIDGDLTVAQEKEQNIRPYWVIMRPDEVLDWVVDPFDKFKYLKRCQVIDNIDASFNHQTIERYYEWTPQNIKISDIDVTVKEKPQLVDSKIIANKLGKIPVVLARYERSKVDKFMGQSFLTDIAYMGREVMNLTSLLQEFLYRQCFNILAMEQDPNVPETEQSQGEIGTANMLRHPMGTKAPSYITPPVAPAKFLQDERTGIVNAMYRIAAQDTVNELFNGAKASGYSKSQSFRTTVPKIATRADVLERTEVNLLKLTFEYMGKTWDGTIKYKDHYEITNLTDALQQMTVLFKDLQLPSETFVKAELKRMIHEFDGKLTEEEIQKAEKEIDTMDFDAWQATQKLAYVGRAAEAPVGPVAFENDGVGKSAATSAVKGKDTSAKSSTPTRASSSSAEIQKESKKGS